MCFSAPKAPKIEPPAPPPPEVKPLGNEALEKKKSKDKSKGRKSLAIPIGKSQAGSGLGIPRG